MSSTEITDTSPWPDRTLTEAQQKNREAASQMIVTRSGAVPMNFGQMVDYAKFMSTARGAVGAHLMGNVGGCLAVMEIANQFGLPAYAVARQSYLVNGRIAFMGQFFHSIVEDYAPLEKGANGRKLQFRFEGDGDTLKIIVSGTFKGASEPVVYESPEWKNITVKNSPLWKSEPKRQFIYFGVRGWQTINWSEGMMHAISEDEAAALPPSEYARDITPISDNPGQALLDRVAAAKAKTVDADQAAGIREGFTADHAHKETTLMVVDKDTGEVKGEVKATPEQIDQIQSGHPVAESPVFKEPEPEHEILPTTIAEWKVYALAWINEAKTDPKITAEDMNKSWKSDIPLRNNCGVAGSPAVRDEVYDIFLAVRDDKPKDDAKSKSKKK